MLVNYSDGLKILINSCMCLIIKEEIQKKKKIMLSSCWKLIWKRWKLILIGVTMLFVLIQIGNMSILGFTNDSIKSLKVNKHRMHAAVKKVIDSL